MTSIKQVLSAKEVQYQLKMEQYPPVWLMMMKLRSIFPIRTPEEVRGEKIKRGAGSKQQAKVLVIVESKPVDTILHGYLSTATVQSLGKANILAEKSKRQSVGNEE